MKLKGDFQWIQEEYDDRSFIFIKRLLEVLSDHLKNKEFTSHSETIGRDDHDELVIQGYLDTLYFQKGRVSQELGELIESLESLHSHN